MKCICPACGRATQVPPDLLDFLVRCERCGTLLRAKITNFGAADREDHLVAQTVPLGRWREDPFSIRPTVLDVLTPPARGNAHPRLFRAAAARAAAVLHPLASMMPEPIAAEAVAIEQPRGTSPARRVSNLPMSRTAISRMPPQLMPSPMRTRTRRRFSRGSVRFAACSFVPVTRRWESSACAASAV